MVPPDNATLPPDAPSLPSVTSGHVERKADVQWHLGAHVDAMQSGGWVEARVSYSGVDGVRVRLADGVQVGVDPVALRAHTPCNTRVDPGSINCCMAHGHHGPCDETLGKRTRSTRHEPAWKHGIPASHVLLTNRGYAGRLQQFWDGRVRFRKAYIKLTRSSARQCFTPEDVSRWRRETAEYARAHCTCSEFRVFRKSSDITAVLNHLERLTAAPPREHVTPTGGP